MPTPSSVLELVQRFSDNIANYKSGQYNETQARVEFIDPLFVALGWDVHNAQGYAEAYKDVIHEDKVKVGGIMKAPDYSFRIGMTRKFFVEAKKPALDLKSDVDPAFQLRRYAWSAKLPLSILTDFEEFAVYDGRIPPNANDGAGVARIKYYAYTDYVNKWDEIAALFSKEAVLKGAFDRFADDKKTKRGTTQVDAAFLAEIEGWRSALAVNLAAKNPALTIRQLNFAAQKTIDRIIFLRICEDRGIEEMGRLLSLLNGKNVYERLLVQFREADERYNSGLFHFQTEKGRDEGERDTLSLTLKIEDGVLKDILKSLYYPSPYAFEVFPADILGQVYEQFLGKVIVLDSKHRASVEEKPEVRKAGGVYYTPTYIVDYIVGQTVGKLLENKTPRQVEPLKILDPACGSGSFLIGAYQKLLDWHLQWYETEGAEKLAKGKEPKVYQTAGGGYRLTTTERRRILLNNIYGVDIDPQAVEVTKLSLLLKMLEGETRQTVRTQTSLSLGRVLPDLAGNIQCGNSLIGSDFYDNRQMTMLDEEEMYRVNAFDWHKAFPQILNGVTPGFDVVLGNPPYLGGREWKNENGRAYEYFVHKYKVADYQFDIYILFWEQCVTLLKQKGLVGLITPNTWLNNQSCLKLRTFLLEHTTVVSIADYSREQVFANVTVLPIVTILERASNAQHQVEVLTPTAGTLQAQYTVPQSLWAEDEQKIFNIGIRAEDVAIRKKVEAVGVSLETLARIKFGIKIYETGKGIPPQTSDFAKNHVYESTSQIDETYRRYLEGKDIQPYVIQYKSRWLKYGDNLAARRDADLFTGSRLLVRRIVGERLIATFTDTDYVTSQLLQIVKPNDAMLAYYLLGILNSHLIAYYFRKKYNRQDKTFPEIRVYELASLPILAIDFDNPADVERHAKMVSLVEQMLSLHVKLAAADSTSRTVLQRQIETTDAQIDRLVYALYGLSLEEVAIVEANG